MNGQRDAIVVGAGIVGIRCARYLQREGFSVTVVTRDPPGEACSAGNSGGFGVSLIAPVATPGILSRVPSLRSPSAVHRRSTWRPSLPPASRDVSRLRETPPARRAVPARLGLGKLP